MVVKKSTHTAVLRSNNTSKTSRELGSATPRTKEPAQTSRMTLAGFKKDSRLQNGSSHGFRTDSAIAGSQTSAERMLQRWQPDSEIGLDMSLESSSNDAPWDQFAENHKRFGLTSDYDESFYTTPINREHPDYARKMAEADRKAREIENSATNNSHVREERLTENLTVDDTLQDEEDRFSGVLGKQNLSSTISKPPSNKYTPPARRNLAVQPAVNAAPQDPAIISASRPTKQTAETSLDTVPQTTASGLKLEDTPISVSTTYSAAVPSPAKSLASTKSPVDVSILSSVSKTHGNEVNATATVERDVFHAFKGFAAQQRVNADRARTNKARADKESKLSDLKKFSETFKLHSEVPKDLIPIIAKDPAKQKEIQERSKRIADQLEQEKHVKTVVKDATGREPIVTDPTISQRAPLAGSAAVPHSGVRDPQISVMESNLQHSKPNTAQLSRGPRSGQVPPQPHHSPAVSTLSSRLRVIEHTKDGRAPLSGQSNVVDPQNLRRSSGANGLVAARLNPNSNEFRPGGFGAVHNAIHSSISSSPGSAATSLSKRPIMSVTGSLLRQRGMASSPTEMISGRFDLLDEVAKIKPGMGKSWAENGDMRPAYDTAPIWRQPEDSDAPEAVINQTYDKMFEFNNHSTRAAQSRGAGTPNSQIAHQHQLPFHHQQAGQNLNTPRQSPRQLQIHPLNNHTFSHGHSANYATSEDHHRMLPSHSVQHFASPRLQQVSVAYTSPMGQAAQVVYNQPQMPYSMASNNAQMQPYRSYSSGGHHYMPQQPTHMAGPVMISAPTSNGFMGAPGIINHGGIMYPVGSPHFVAPGPLSNMSGTNEYPSPGRGAPVMSQQGSQHGYMYGTSPSLPFNQPVYNQTGPAQMSNARPPFGQQQYSTSPQSHYPSPAYRTVSSGNYNKTFRTSPQPQAQQPPVQTGSPLRGDGGEASK